MLPVDTNECGVGEIEGENGNSKDKKRNHEADNGKRCGRKDMVKIDNGKRKKDRKEDEVEEKENV